MGIDAIDSSNGYEYLGRMLITDRDASIGVTLQAQYADRSAEYRLKRRSGLGSGDFYFQARSAGASKACTAMRTGVVPDPLRWYRFRLQVSPDTEGTRVRAKVWEETESEPESWHASCFEARVDGLVAGEAGVWSIGNRSQYWEDLELVDLCETSSDASCARRVQRRAGADAR